MLGFIFFPRATPRHTIVALWGCLEDARVLWDQLHQSLVSLAVEIIVTRAVAVVLQRTVSRIDIEHKLVDLCDILAIIEAAHYELIIANDIVHVQLTVVHCRGFANNSNVLAFVTSDVKGTDAGSNAVKIRKTIHGMDPVGNKSASVKISVVLGKKK